MVNIAPETTDAKTAQMSPFAPVGARPRPCQVVLARCDLCVCFLGVPCGGSRSLLHQYFFMSAYKFHCDASLIPGFSVLEVLVANTLLDPPASSTPFHTLIFPARYSVPSRSASSLTIRLSLLTDSDSLYPSVISHFKTQNKFDPYESRRRQLLFIIDTDCVHFPAMHLCDRSVHQRNVEKSSVQIRDRFAGHRAHHL